VNRHKIKVGKNGHGWFVCVPQGWGGFHVIEDVGSWAGAMSLAHHIVGSWSDNWKWM
jgi:hypothetical protein